MDAHIKAEHDRSFADKAKDALHSAASKTKQFAHQVKDSVTEGITEARIIDAEEELGEIKERERRHDLEREYLDKERAEAAEKVAHLKAKGASGVFDAVEDEGILAERVRRDELDSQYLKEEELRAAEKVAHLKEKQEHHCQKKSHEGVTSDLSQNVNVTTHTTGIH
uniref:Uncharacterized protein n=1 Tax=Plectus sambesii TaxID=2011161 RepID=A0A914WP01_9BILA